MVKIKVYLQKICEFFFFFKDPVDCIAIGPDKMLLQYKYVNGYTRHEVNFNFQVKTYFLSKSRLLSLFFFLQHESNFLILLVRF
jgi:hypothetical protein